MQQDIEAVGCRWLGLAQGHIGTAGKAAGAVYITPGGKCGEAFKQDLGSGVF